MRIVLAEPEKGGVAATWSDGLKEEILSIRAELRRILELIDGHDSKRTDDV